MTKVAELEISELAEYCAEETSKFNRHELNDPQFCFELLRRALLYDMSDAFSHMCRVYEPLVHRWVYSYSRFFQSGEDADYFANAALSKFYFALHGTKFEQFDSLPKVLFYLKRCIHTEIAQHIRRQPSMMPVPLPEEDLTPAPKTEPDVDAHQLWKLVNDLLPDVKDRVLARCLFIEDMKPAQVFENYPDQWNSPRDVSVARQRITRTLRRSEEIRRWMGMDASPEN